jgi:hypothetical protein
MEPLWSPVVATIGNLWQIAQAREPRNQAKTVAVDCDRAPEKFHGKEGVDGSSPPEGLKSLQIGLVRCLFRRNQERSVEGVSKSPICRGSGDAQTWPCGKRE